MQPTNNTRRRITRRLSVPAKDHFAPFNYSRCQPALPYALEALDLPGSSPIHTLASVRIIVLDYLEDLERRLQDVESPDFDAWKAKGTDTMEEARAWARTALDMLASIRADVCSHLPDLPFIVNDISPHVPELEIPSLDDVRSHLPGIPSLRSRISELGVSGVRSTLDDVRVRINEFDFPKPCRFIPVLSERLSNLHSHLTSDQLSLHLGISTWTPTTMLSDIFDTVLSSEFIQSLTEETNAVECDFELTAKDVAQALKRSLRGLQLITRVDLPAAWQSNPFVTNGYRFIPLESWPLILLSLFTFHNETLNIHTHLVPFFLWGLNSIPYWNSSFTKDTPEMAFTAFALLCLLSSSIWHTMSGCSHHASMEFCARVDYIGIGWLISASVGTVVYYGYHCHPELGRLFLGVCLVMGISGNVFPFMEWFNKYEYRGYRISFFLALACSAIAPLTGLVMLHSTSEVWHFVSPVLPSLVSYVVGLIFYTTHVPERWLSETWCRRLDAFGGGSHCIWHLFIVLAVSQHKAAMESMRPGMQCVTYSL